MTEQPKDGGPAFPARPREQMMGGTISATNEGMSLRDWFAGQALMGVLAGGLADTIPHDDINGGRDAAFFAYQYADAMIAERVPA